MAAGTHIAAADTEQAPLGLLRRVENVVGALPEPWREAFIGVPRHAFLPDVIWLRRAGGEGHERVVRADDPARWWDAAYADVPVVVQVRDGMPWEAGQTPWPSSSVSQPSIVAATLLALEPAVGDTVLEIGTGAGWNAGLLAHRLGGDRVVTVEVDPVLAAGASGRLEALDLRPRVVTGDGEQGWAPGGPYRRIVCTCSVTRVPGAWLEQTAPGGRIVTPWATAWAAYGTLRLDVGEDGGARGRFGPGGAFMAMRGHRSPVADVADVVRPDHRPDTSITTLSPWAVAGGDRHDEAVMGLLLPGLWTHWNDEPEETGVRSRLWVGDDAGTSWASVDYDGHQLDTFHVRQHGPRRVWDEVETAWGWWNEHGRPAFDTFGLDVHPDGKQRVWCDKTPGAAWAVPRH
ncbi:methyltransferase [Embleya sp. NPDC020630]|uniref:methyltransferase n=1 Tax=Embleya sp. NPDC020630 TaxID=3363979 RepID=UPI00378A339B